MDRTQTPQSETRAILTECNALITDGHFVYACGSHGSGWIAKDLVNLDPRHPLRLGERLQNAAESSCRARTLCVAPPSAV